MSLLSVHKLRYRQSTDGQELFERVTTAVAKAAVDILAEADNTAEHTRRLRWALAVLHDGATTQHMAERMYWATLGTSPITTKENAATDAEIITVVTGLVNRFLPVTDEAAT